MRKIGGLDVFRRKGTIRRVVEEDEKLFHARAAALEGSCSMAGQHAI